MARFTPRFGVCQDRAEDGLVNQACERPSRARCRVVSIFEPEVPNSEPGPPPVIG